MRLGQHYRRHFLEYEFVAAFLVTGLLVLLAEVAWGRGELLETLDGTRQVVYAALASIAGSLLGFMTTSISIIIAFGDSPRLRIVRESGHYPTLLNVFLNTIYMLGLTTIWALVALFLDRDDSSRIWVTYLALLAAIASTLRVYRSIWALGKVIAVAAE